MPPRPAEAPAGGARRVVSRRVAAPPLLRLIRWPNALIAAAGVILGAWWAAGAVARATWLAVLAAAALAALANAYNDYADVEIDRVAHPDRPLPRGELTPRAALATAAAAAALAALCSTAASPALGAATALVALLMVLYSVRLKRHGLVGNATVALLASLPFVYGAASVGRAAAGVPLFALAVPLHLAREVAKDLDDAAGDAARRRTLPLSRGAGAARATVVASLALFAVVSLLFFARRAPAAATLLLPALILVAAAARRAAAGAAGGPSLLKGAMLCAMAAAAALAAWVPAPA
ncbi:MAG: UbiA family prenyltransferase [Gemmatimonadaceae bacterium]